MQHTIDLDSIKSDMVGFDHPYCVKHGRKHKIYRTQPKWNGQVLEVVRYHYCEECRCEGAKNPPPLFNSRVFNFDTTG